jgi:hypothetical protein
VYARLGDLRYSYTTHSVTMDRGFDDEKNLAQKVEIRICPNYEDTNERNTGN